MTDSSRTHAYTAAAFEEFLKRPENVDRLFELIDGEIVEKMPAELHNLIILKLLLKLAPFVGLHNLGRVVHETRCRPPGDDDLNVRIPDIAFTTRARLLPVVREGAVPQIPDLCIEVQSPGDYPKQMRAKAEYYLQHGAQQVWLIYTGKEFVEVLYADGNYEHFLKGDTLAGGDLIPGFSIAVTDIFDVERL